MGVSFLKQAVGKCLTNFPGWRTRRKIVIIESDDWGSIRMPSRAVYEKCLKAGYPVDQNPFERYDSLASEEDLELLFGLLKSIRDKNGSNPVITANCVVANPDFQKIREDGMQKYHYELITETFKRYPKHGRNFGLWKQGMAEKIFHPQFHAREHVNVSLFMNALRVGKKEALWGFDNEMPGSIQLTLQNSGNDYVEATHYKTEKDKKEKLEIYLEGLNLFEKLFGYRSLSIIPTNYIWSPGFDKPVSEKGVRFFQGNRRMYEPIPGAKPRYHNYFLGKSNRHGQLYLVRNATFEPTITQTNDPVGQCLREIGIAFLMHKPAIICSHRINFVGHIDPANRDKNLMSLELLLKSVLKKWPDVEFMTSDILGELITNPKTT